MAILGMNPRLLTGPPDYAIVPSTDFGNEIKLLFFGLIHCGLPLRPAAWFHLIYVIIYDLINYKGFTNHFCQLYRNLDCKRPSKRKSLSKQLERLF